MPKQVGRKRKEERLPNGLTVIQEKIACARAARPGGSHTEISRAVGCGRSYVAKTLNGEKGAAVLDRAQEITDLAMKALKKAEAVAVVDAATAIQRLSQMALGAVPTKTRTDVADQVEEEHDMLGATKELARIYYRDGATPQDDAMRKVWTSLLAQVPDETLRQMHFHRLAAAGEASGLVIDVTPSNGGGNGRPH